MTTIADSLQNAAQAVTDASTAYQGAAAALNNEIGAVATSAGLDPAQNVGTRFLRAVRSGQLAFAVDTSTTPGTITIAPTVAHTAYLTGLPLVVQINNDIVGATQINLSGLGLRLVVQPGGAALVQGDYRKGDVITLMCLPSGNFVSSTPVSTPIIDTAITKTVYGAGADFPDLNTAFAWLGRRRIASTGFVSFQLPIGVNANAISVTSDILVSHPDGSRVAILGKPLNGSLPAGASMSFTGNGASQRATDTGVNLTLLRTYYQTEFKFTGGARFVVQGNLSNLQDILFTSDGSVASSDTVVLNYGAGQMTRCASVGSGYRGVLAFGYYLNVAGNCYALGAKDVGFLAAAGGTISLLSNTILIGMSNGAAGVYANRGAVNTATGATATQIYARGNGFGGVVSAYSSSVNAPQGSQALDNVNNGFGALSNSSLVCSGCNSNNNVNGVAATGESFIDASNTTGANTNVAYYADTGATVVRTGGTATGSNATASPAVGSVGNSNAYIA